MLIHQLQLHPNLLKKIVSLHGFLMVYYCKCVMRYRWMSLIFVAFKINLKGSRDPTLGATFLNCIELELLKMCQDRTLGVTFLKHEVKPFKKNTSCEILCWVPCF